MCLNTDVSHSYSAVILNSQLHILMNGAYHG